MVQYELEIYGHPGSQPSRAIIWLCCLKNVPFKLIESNPVKSRSKRQFFIQNINPTGRIPAIKDISNSDFIVYESAAIMTYLAHKYQWNELYPSNNLRRRALIDQYLHWHHENVRKITLGYLRHLLRIDIDPKKWDYKIIKQERKSAELSLNIMENKWLALHKYIIDDHLSIADVLCYEEVVQIRWWNLIKLFDKKYPNINKWLDRMQILPNHDKCHTMKDILKPIIMSRARKLKGLIAKL